MGKTQLVSPLNIGDCRLTPKSDPELELVFGLKLLGRPRNVLRGDLKKGFRRLSQLNFIDVPDIAGARPEDFRLLDGVAVEGWSDPIVQANVVILILGHMRDVEREHSMLVSFNRLAAYLRYRGAVCYARPFRTELSFTKMKDDCGVGGRFQYCFGLSAKIQKLDHFPNALSTIRTGRGEMVSP
jgi:hypothetical protein